MFTPLVSLALSLAPMVAADQPIDDAVVDAPVAAEAAAEMALPAWRSFYDRFSADRFAYYKRRQGYYVRVFWDPYACWWVVEW